ncbi:MAG: vWA domain-containing protein [Devosia sp.]
MPLIRKLVPAFLALALSALPVAAAERTIIILDGSGSMWTQIDGEARISIARETLDGVLGSLPDDLELGFMTYGHREKGACDDIELLVEPATGTAAAISEAAAAINPKGKTPISAAVRQAAEALRYTEDKATVILITDGIETCEADPCALASELEGLGVDFTTHVVGFGLTDEEGAQVACLAENTGGRYFQASDAGALADALTTTVAQAAAPEPEPVLEFNLDPDIVLVEGGESLGDDVSPTWQLFAAKPDGGKGEQLATEYGSDWKTSLEPGNYVLAVSLGYAKAEQPVTIEAGAVAEPFFVLNGGRLIIRPRPAEGADIDDGAAVFTEFPGGDSTTGYGEVDIYVPAGETKVTVSIGQGKLAEAVAVAAGETVEQDFVVGVGRATINAYYAEGMKVEEGGLAVKVLEAKKDIQGNRKEVSYAYGPDSGHDLPPGDYVAYLEMDQAVMEVPFAIETGALTEVNGVLDAGVLAVTAPNAYSIDIFSTKKDIQGSRKQFGNAYGAERAATLPAGDYAVVVTLNGDAGTKEATATVVAGERTELTVQ